MAVPGGFNERDARAEQRIRARTGVNFLAEFAVSAYRLARFGRGRDPDEAEIEASKIADMIWDGFGYRYFDGGDLQEGVDGEDGGDDVGEMESGDDQEEGVDDLGELDEDGRCGCSECAECSPQPRHRTSGDEPGRGTNGKSNRTRKSASNRQRGQYHYELAAQLVQHYLIGDLRDRDGSWQEETSCAELADRAVRLADAVVERLEK